MPYHSREAIGNNDTQLTKTRTVRNNLVIDMWDLFNIEMTDIPIGTSLSERRRGLVNSRGFELDTLCRVVTQNYNDPGNTALQSDLYFVNIAVLAVKNTNQIVLNEFFRSRNNDDDRVMDFSGSLGSMDLHFSPINTDKYTVLKHKRHTLTTFQSNRGNYYSHDSWWIPIDRELEYLDSIDCTTPIFFCVWVCRAFKDSSVDPGLPSLDLQFRITHHFKEPV